MWQRIRRQQQQKKTSESQKNSFAIGLYINNVALFFLFFSSLLFSSSLLLLLSLSSFTLSSLFFPPTIILIRTTICHSVKRIINFKTDLTHHLSQSNHFWGSKNLLSCIVPFHSLNPKILFHSHRVKGWTASNGPVP